MTTALIGKKIGMTQLYTENGTIVPVTVIQLGPCTIMQVKDIKPDGYFALQLGYEDVKPSRRKKPQIGHAKKAECEPKKFVHEVRLTEATQSKLGDELTVSVFDDVKYVDIAGTTKGKGFAGVVKRYGFKGQLASHGVERKHRSPGSISMAPGANGRSVKKGKKMAGHMGHVKCSTRNHEIIKIDHQSNLLVVKGSIPGSNNGYVVVSKAKTKS